MHGIMSSKEMIIHAIILILCAYSFISSGTPSGKFKWLALSMFMISSFFGGWKA